MLNAKHNFSLALIEAGIIKRNTIHHNTHADMRAATDKCTSTHTHTLTPSINQHTYTHVSLSLSRSLSLSHTHTHTHSAAGEGMTKCAVSGPFVACCHHCHHVVTKHAATRGNIEGTNTPKM